MTEIIIAVATAVISGVGGSIVYFIRKHFKRLEDYTESAEERRLQKDLLVLKSLKAIGELTVANSIAVKQGHCNGEIDKVKKEFEGVDKELHAFLMESTVKKVNKKYERIMPSIKEQFEQHLTKAILAWFIAIKLMTIDEATEIEKEFQLP